MGTQFLRRSGNIVETIGARDIKEGQRVDAGRSALSTPIPHI